MSVFQLTKRVRAWYPCASSMDAFSLVSNYDDREHQAPEHPPDTPYFGQSPAHGALNCPSRISGVGLDVAVQLDSLASDAFDSPILPGDSTT